MDASGSFRTRIWNVLILYPSFSNVYNLLRIESLRLCDVLRQFRVEFDRRHRLRSSWSTRPVASSDRFLRSDTIQIPLLQVADATKFLPNVLGSARSDGEVRCDARRWPRRRREHHMDVETSRTDTRTRTESGTRSGWGSASKGEAAPIERTTVKGEPPGLVPEIARDPLGGRSEGEDDPS